MNRALLTALPILLVMGCEGPVVSLGDDGHPTDAAVAHDAQPNRRDASHSEEDEDELECLEHEPVCGEDGESYFNVCYAHDAGVDVVSRGECK